MNSLAADVQDVYIVVHCVMCNVRLTHRGDVNSLPQSEYCVRLWFPACLSSLLFWLRSFVSIYKSLVTDFYEQGL